MTTAIGIDLGTTNCCLCIVEGERATPVFAPDGQATFPSVVAFLDDEQILVGAAAARQAITNPTRTIFGMKRLMGRKATDADIMALKQTAPFQIVAAPNGDACVQIEGRRYSPQELCALLLEALKEHAEAFLDETVEKAVITVPAFFDERQRQATKDAARLAGLKVLRLLNEPTAAALANGFSRSDRRRLAVFDLGGGTFDVSVLDVKNEKFEVLANAGDNTLGGDDFDRRLMASIIDDFKHTEQVDLRDNPAAMQRLYHAARQAKHELSHVSNTSIEVPFIAKRGSTPLHLRHELDRRTFEKLVAAELGALFDPCAMALEDCGLGTDDIDDILLVGGMTRMPAVQQIVAKLFRRQLRKGINPDEVVAQGAALQAAALDGDLNVVLEDVTPHSLGIRTKGGRFSVVIGRNTRVPCQAEKPFRPVSTKQNHVMIEVYQGESESVKENTSLGRFRLSELPVNSHVMVNFKLDENGLLSVSAREPKTGKAAAIELQPTSGLSDAQIRRILGERHRRALKIRMRKSKSKSKEDAEATRPLENSKPVDKPAPSATASLEHRFQTPAPASARSILSARPGRASDHAPVSSHSETLPPAASSSKRKPGNGLDRLDRNLIGTLIDGRYSVLELLGEGGMGRVYLAQHNALQRHCAVKVLHKELAINRLLAERFVLEARAAAAIDSPHVVDISDFGELDDGSGYFVMEYLEGITLQDLLNQRGTLPAKLVAKVGAQIANGLAAAHALDIVHRDLKPDNITLIERDGDPYFCKIVDFGIARAPRRNRPNQRITEAGSMVGTPIYMAPEQMEGQEVDARSDIYSLGVVMYELLSGAPPFESETVVGLLAQHKYSPPIPIRQRATGANCPTELEDVVLQCLSKAPEDRFSTGYEVAAALRAIADHRS